MIIAGGIETRSGTGSTSGTDLCETDILDASGFGYSVRTLGANVDSGIAPGLNGRIP